MQILSAASQLNLNDSIISIGNFDGVHLGHQMLLKQMQEDAQKFQKNSVIISFFPPSKHHFSGAPFLSTKKEKLELLKAFKPDAVVIIDFNDAYTKTPKEVFLNDLAKLNPHTIIVGENFKFGFKREGNLYDLSQLAGRLEVFNLKHGEGQPISSSRIRDLLKQGEISEVNNLLGRNYQASGQVIKGEQRGRTIGYPTANIQTKQGKALPIGVFAVTTQIKQSNYKGMANVGPRPSFPNHPPSLEVNLFDTNTDLYDQELTVTFHQHLRAQRKFTSLDDLKEQLKHDEETTRAVLSHM